MEPTSDSDPAIQRFQAKIYGRVQGVGFRVFVSNQAQLLQLPGSARNVYFPNRHVAVVAEGPEAKLKRLIALLHQGPAMARVDKVDIAWLDPLGDEQTFRIG
ncbi:MAG: acylphosphatase [Chloroflexi bacterium]|nr:acylphosphatase [Chloroflexota bacterium]